MNNKFLSHIFNWRIICMFCLGFASGLPLSLTGSTLQAWFTESGVSLMGIGLLTLVGQPYIYKFIWAPLMDRFIPPFLGRRRGWIMITQIALIIAIGSMAFFDPKSSPTLLAVLALIVAFLSASADISIGAYLADTFGGNDKERGMGAASYTTGYRIAIIIAGALALVFAQYCGWHMTYILMSLFMIVGVVITWLAPEPAADNSSQKQASTNIYQAIVLPFKEFFTRHGIIVATIFLLIIIFYKFGDAFALSLNTAFLIRQLHFSLSQIAIAYKVMGFVASIMGGIAGGILMARMSLFRGLIIFGILQGIANIGYMVLVVVGHNFTVLMGAMFIENFCGGLGTTAFLAMVMVLCSKKYSATQFALLTAISAIGRVFIGPLAAVVVDNIGWMWFYFASIILCVPGLALIVMVKDKFG